MKTAQIEKDKIIIKEAEKPMLSGRKGAIAKVLGCGLCGSDIVKFRHHLAGDGTVLGHEIVAQISEIVSDTDFKAGDKIVSSHHIPCGKCVYCIHGNVSMCGHFKSTNILPGGFSEYVFLSEEHLENTAFRVPDNITDEEISFYEPLSCCIRAIKRCGLMAGDNVLVTGLGSVGILMAQAVKAMGFNVFGCDLLSQRIEILENLGIHSFNSSDKDFSDTIKSLTDGIGVDAVFMTSGADKAIDTALSVIRKGGKISVFSSTPLNSGYPNNEIYYKELTVMGSYSPSLADLKDSFEMITKGRIKLKNLTAAYSLNEIQKAFDDTISNKILKAYIKIA